MQTIVYAIWKFRNRATFYNGRDDHRAIIKYVLQDAKFRIHCDFVSVLYLVLFQMGFTWPRERNPEKNEKELQSGPGNNAQTRKPVTVIAGD